MNARRTARRPPSPISGPTVPLPIVTVVAIVLATACSAGPAASQEDASIRSRNAAAPFSVASFNVHYVSVRNGLDEWERRSPAVGDAIASLDADILAFQEMETFGGGHFDERNIQLEYVLAHHPGYEVAATGDPERYPSTQPILFRPGRFEPLEQGFFFFSPEPDRIYSRPWHARYPAFASWVRFQDAVTKASLLVFNVHFDASSARNRTKSARLLFERYASIAAPGEPTLIIGDFNAPRFFPTMRILARGDLHRAPTIGPTFHFGTGVGVIPSIDHLLGSDGIRFLEASVLRDRFDAGYPSDHYPVHAVVVARGAAAE